MVVFVVIRLQPGNIRRFKAAVLQLDAVGHLHGRGGEFCAVGAGDLDLIVQPFRIPDTGNAGIQRSVQPVLAARRDVPRIAGAKLLRDLLPVGAVLAAVPGVHSAVESVRAAVDLRCKAAVGPNAVHQLCACDNGSLRRGVRRGEQRIHHEGACGLGRCRGVSRRGRRRLTFGFRCRRVRVGGRNRRRRLRRGGQLIRRKHSVGHACRHTAGQQHSQQTFFHVRFLLCRFPVRGLSPRRVNWEYTVRRPRNTSRAAFCQKVTKKTHHGSFSAVRLFCIHFCPAPFRKRPPMGHLRAGHARPLLSLQWGNALLRQVGRRPLVVPTVLGAVYTTVTSVSQSPVTAYLPLPAGIK